MNFRSFGFLIFLYSIVTYANFASESTQTKVYLKPRTIVFSPQIKLSDITNWKGEEDPILFSNLNSPKILKPDELKSILQKEFDKSSNRCSVCDQIDILGKEAIILPKTKSVSKEELETALKDFLAMNMEIDLKDFRFYAEQKNNLVVAGGETRFRKIGKTLHGGRRLFPLDTYLEGKLVYSESIPFLIEEKKQAYFTTKEIPAKEIIVAEDVELKEFFSAEFGREFVLENPIGKTALSALPAGYPIERKQIRLLNTVERGSEVALVYTTGNIMLKIKARALASGNPGDRIPVLNTVSQKRIEAVVQTDGVCLLEEGKL